MFGKPFKNLYSLAKLLPFDEREVIDIVFFCPQAVAGGDNEERRVEICETNG